MAEPRMRTRQKGQQFPHQDIEALLHAFGDKSPLPSTAAVLDEIITDFIIETCHAAALSASYSRRQKIKVDDFKWVLRRDSNKLGRVAEIFFVEKILKESRKAFTFENPEALARKGKNGDVLGGLAGVVGEEDLDGGGGGGRKRKKRKVEEK